MEWFERLAGEIGDELYPEPDDYDEPKEIVLTCSDCPDSECTGHCLSCMYGAQ